MVDYPLAVRRARVAALCAVARRIADARDPLGQEARVRLAHTAGLSGAGIELALGEHLEHSPSAAELDALLARFEPAAARCHVSLAANVCTAALRALACALALAPVVAVRASRRDPVLCELLVREALLLPPYRGSSEPPVTLVAVLEPRAGDVVHAYGGDDTLAALAASLASRAPGIELHTHGSGVGIAAVGASDPLLEVEPCARALAADVVPFDQAGCLSPRIAFVSGGPARAQAFAHALDRALEEAAARVPRGALDPATEAALARFATSYAAAGEVLLRPSHVVAFDPAPEALLLPPPARAVLVVPADVAPPSAGSRVGVLLGPLARALTCIGSAGAPELARALAACAPFARTCALGRMQKPPFDGPVDLRGADLRPR